MTQKNIQQNKGKIKGITLHLVVLVILAVAMTAGIVMVSAKYVKQTENQDAAVAAEFYFESDLLDGKTHELTALNANGTASIDITLKNHADALRYSETGITYTVTVDNGGTVSNADDTIAGGAVNDATITISDLQPGQTYTVTATATAPYAKTLTGTFNVNAADNAVHFSQQYYDAYTEVTVWTVDYSDSVSLTCPQGLIPDNTDSMMRDWKTGNTDQTKTFLMGTNSSHVFRFFKTADNSTQESKVSVNAAK